MEKCYHLNAEEEQELGVGGGFVDNPYPYPFHSSSPLGIGGFSSLQSITHHKPLLFDNPYQTSTSLSLIPKTEPTHFHNISDQPPLFHLPNEENPDTVPQLQTESPTQLNSRVCTRLKYERQREIGRRRRQRVREKIASLKELVPMQNKRMDTATLLENAGKYIKYLEAQVRVLEGMAVDDCLVSEDMIMSGGGMARNRLLQMMVDSEVIQGKMSSQGMCVYSVEQLVEIIGRLFTSDEASLLLNSILFSTAPCAPY